MALRIPPSLLMTAALLAGATLASGASRLMQREQSKQADMLRAVVLTGGDPLRGKSLFAARGCGACHAVSGDRAATGVVGPPLGKLAPRAFVAGRQPNDPSHLIAWVQHPQTIEPGVGMPDAGLSDQEARDVAAYLYTLR